VTSGRDTVEAQVARVDDSRLEGRRDLPRVRRVDVLPELVAAAGCGRAISRDGALSLPLGRRFDDLDPVSLDISDGEHVLVIGPGRSGRSSVLVRLLRAWSDALPAGWIGIVAPRRSPLRDLPFAGDHGLVDHVPPAGPALLVVDDAELVDDGSGALTRLVASRRPGLLVVAAGRPEALRTAYGHWTTTVRRSRLGIVMTGARDLDADLLGTTLPRWSPIPPRRGLAYMVCDGTETLVQCALDDAPPVCGRPDGRRRDATRSLVAVS
jgi:S-DNA-T family DNA segregation ATPase FtsK/SpoIIIE